MSAGLQAALFDEEKESAAFRRWEMSGPVTIRPARDVEHTFPNGTAALSYLKSCFEQPAGGQLLNNKGHGETRPAGRLTLTRNARGEAIIRFAP